MSNIVAFPLNQASEAPRLGSDGAISLRKMEDARSEIQLVFTRLTAILEELKKFRLPARLQLEAATMRQPVSGVRQDRSDVR
ncbi:hypothetical protein [Rhizobium sp. R693]|uniref:hypothetical protein n=1 Tax=Rhizobium sp. R693 TaxID=1764276 RepID=UPI000B52CAE6|nr:hypothetical protein [Rhizobium sp. R693]OWV94721.1 hypothetical protein ATY79_26140 [Rhizobium sp. R693]